MSATKDTIALAVKLSGRAAASKEAKALRKDVKPIGPETQTASKQASAGLAKVERQAKKTGDAGASGMGKFRRGVKSGGDEVKRQTPRMNAAASPLGKLAKRAAAAGAAFMGLRAANDAVDTVEELATSVMGLTGHWGMANDEAGRWAGLLKARGMEPKALNQALGTLSKNVTAVAPAADKQRAALDKLNRTQEEKLRATDDIVNAQKREATREKIMAQTTSKRADLQGKSLGRQAEAIDKLGLSQADAVGASKDMYGFLLKVADGYEKMGPGTDRAALAMSLFGKGWQTLRPLLSGGSKGLKDQLGLIDEYGANVGDSKDSVAEMIAQQREQKIAMLGIKVQLGTELLPLYKRGGKLVLEFTKQARKNWPMIKEQITPVVETTEDVVEAVGKIVEKHPGLIKVAAGFIAVATAAKGLRLAGQVSGLNTVLRLLWKMKSSSAAASAAGAAAGAEYSSAAAEAAGRRKMPWKTAGGTLGAAFGAAIAIKVVDELTGAITGDKISDKLREALTGRDKGGRKTMPGTRDASSGAEITRAEARKRGLKPEKMNPYSIEQQARMATGPGAAAAQAEKRKKRKRQPKKRAGGGAVRRGETTLVGERGPETAIFRPGTQILQADSILSRLLSGQQIQAPQQPAPRESGRPIVVHAHLHVDGREILTAVAVENERQGLRK